MTTCEDCRDRQAIIDQLNRYAELVDERRPHDAAREVFTEDVVEDHGEGLPINRGRAALGTFLEQATAPFVGVMHFNSNFSIQIDGDTATSRTYYQAVLWSNHEGELGRRAADWMSAGVYLDEWRRTPEGWQISYRRRVNMGPSSVVMGQRPQHLVDMESPRD